LKLFALLICVDSSQDFIKLHDAGTKPKDHVQYQPRKSQIIDHALEHKAAPASPLPNNTARTGNLNTPTPPPPFISPGHTGGGPQNNALHNPSNIPPPFQSPHRGSVATANAGQPTAIALYDFESIEQDDLPFKAGDSIILLSAEEGHDWWQGELNGRCGIFPKNYVQKQNTTAAPVAANKPPPVPAAANHKHYDTNSSTAPGGADSAEAPKLLDAKCQALFDFEGQDADELTFRQGATLIITGELNGWYLGRIDGQQKVGIFPSNYVSLDKALH
jgi:hypothetical protein